MSWARFRNSMLERMNSYPYGDNNGFAEALADEYDKCMKSGSDIVNKNRLKSGNKSAFQSIIEAQQAEGVASTTDAFYSVLFPKMGNAVKAYWAGAKLMETNPPIVVTPPAIKNLYIIPEGNIVTNPGQFGNTSVAPITDAISFINSFIFLCKAHLTTVGGICNTMASYPPPTPPAPSVVQWLGFNVSDQDDGDNDEETISETELAGAKEDLKSAKIAAKTATEEPAKKAALEAIKFFRNKIASKKAAITAGDQIAENPPPPPPPADAAIGNKIVYYARLDIGKTEQPMPPTPPENWGPFVQSCLASTGLSSPAFWCAAFVTKIYKSAGASNPSSAGCDEWRAWAKKKGLWSRQPSIGAAVLFGSEADAHHIGIVETIDSKGNLTTIEGNTTGGPGFNRNGCGVFRKEYKFGSNRYGMILGFVAPQDAKNVKSTKK